MMTLQEINKTYNRIIGLLDVKELKEAFEQTQSLIAGIRDYSFMDQLNELQDTYKYMLRYRLEGAKDPMEDQIYHNLIASAYQLADRVRNKALVVESPLTYYSYRRTLRKQPLPSYAQLHKELREMADCVSETEGFSAQARQRIEIATTQLFNKLWTADPLNTEEVVALQAILRDKQLPLEVACQLISALLLALQASFDIAKLSLLFDAAAQNHEEIRCRALICLLLTLVLYRKRTAVYPEIDRRLAALADLIPGFTIILRQITLRFILARETEKINQRLQNEILPQLLKNNPILNQKIKAEEISPELFSEGMNPEWEAYLSNQQTEKQMEAFAEMQREGADLMHSSFVHLKHYPFFREVSNWFLPFMKSHSAIQAIFKETDQPTTLLDLLTQNRNICNSDKYSLYLSVTDIPQQLRQMMSQKMGDEMLGLIQASVSDRQSPHKQRELIIGQYVQDLYRFFKLYPGHLDFEDVFTYPLDFHNLPSLQPYMADTETLGAIGEYYLRKNYFSEALAVFNQLREMDEEKGELFQKIGYCKQMMGQTEAALQAYLRADLTHSDSKWLNRRIASCYRNLKQPEKALIYYRRLEAKQPDDMNLQINIGHCYLELKNFTEALKYFYKVDYLSSQSSKAWRPIAWCSFLTGKYDQARNYYRKILANQPTTQDYLNAGHTEWVLQQLKQAVHYYVEAVRCEQGQFGTFLEAFQQDIPDLKQAGIEDEEIPLMLDQVRYACAD
ncbi:MAG: tetratricopeptide repeat protein [Parabacteroides sp.]